MVKAGVIVLCMILAFFVLSTLYAFVNTATESAVENRTLSQSPEHSVAAWLEKSFDVEYDAFLSDHVALRDELIQITFTVEKWMRRPSKIRFVDFQ